MIVVCTAYGQSGPSLLCSNSSQVVQHTVRSLGFVLETAEFPALLLFVLKM